MTGRCVVLCLGLAIAFSWTLPFACGGTVNMGQGGGDGSAQGGGATTNNGGGDATTTATSSTTSSSTTTTATTTSTTTSTTASPCDYGGNCTSCKICAGEEPCSDFMQACMNNADCVDLLSCLTGCDQGECGEACLDDYPNGVDDYAALNACVMCGACVHDCNVGNCP